LKKLNRESAGLSLTRPVKVLQFGEGNFLRAFADWIVDVMNEKSGFNSAVQIIQPIVNGMGDALNQQEGLYHLVLNGIQKGKPTKEMRLISCVKGVINPFGNFESFLKEAENPDLQFIISNTTEAGIVFSDTDNNPGVLPHTFPGKVTTFLYRRYQHFEASPEKGVILMPCELIDKNGEKLRRAILEYAALWKLPADFENWIEHHNVFCNTLVDRIVPGFPKESIGEIQARIGYDDNLVVTAEPFHLWVIEGPDSLQEKFPAAKAGLDVKFVKDLTPYRTRKVRILNGAHTSLVPVAYLTGLRTVRDSVNDAAVGEYLRDLVYREIIPTLDLPASELKQFADDVMERFQNPFIKHELISIALNSVSKFKVRVLPSIVQFAALKKTPPEKLLFSMAALIRFYKGTTANETIPLNDAPEILEFFKEAWKNLPIEKIASKVLANTALWDEDLTRIAGLESVVSRHLVAIESKGMAAALKDLH
jgi:tagaturonate reductase